MEGGGRRGGEEGPGRGRVGASNPLPEEEARPPLNDATTASISISMDDDGPKEPEEEEDEGEEGREEEGIDGLGGRRE